MSARLIDKILSEVSLDPRVPDGVFKLEEESHMNVLREYLINHGIEEAVALEFCNKVLEGKYPERQAYNKNGILVTFPTPEYKKKAIQAGTHFEEDPTRGKSNLFQQPSPGKKEPEPTPPPKAGGEPKTSLPVSQAQPAADSGDADKAAPPPQPQTTSAPMPTPEPTTPVPQAAEPTELPPPAPKSPAEKEADKQAIKTMLKGDDYMLERVVEFVLYNGHPSLIEDLRRKL